MIFLKSENDTQTRGRIAHPDSWDTISCSLPCSTVGFFNDFTSHHPNGQELPHPLFMTALPLPVLAFNRHPFVAFLALLFLTLASLPAEKADRFEEALELSREEELPLLVIFTGSDWSQLSITFEKEILNHRIFEKWAETNVVWTLVDLPRVGIDDEELGKRRELMKRFGVETFPMAVFLNAEEQLLGTLTHDPNGPASWINRADAILAGKREESDTAASADYLPGEIRKSLEDDTLSDVQRCIGYYNKALEFEMAEPEISLKSSDRFKLLIDLYSRAEEAAPRDRKDLIFAARHRKALLFHRKGQSVMPQTEEEIKIMSAQSKTDPASFLKMTKRFFEEALRYYKGAAPLKPGDQHFSGNLALAYRDLDRVQAYLDYLTAFRLAVVNTRASLDQEKRFLESLEREVSTRLEVNRLAIEESATAIQDLMVKAAAINDTPTILPEEALKAYRLASEDIALAPSPHRKRELKTSVRHIQDALDHLSDYRKLQFKQPPPPKKDGT